MPIPFYMGVLPFKKRMSYHAFVLMILLEFRKRFGSEKLRLEKVKMDLELGLMQSNQSIFVRFDFQKHGMSTLNTQCESFSSFVRSLVALCYIPPSKILVAMSELEQFQFDPDMPDIPTDDMEKIEKFKSSILQYTYDTWIDGDFHPEVWNYWIQNLWLRVTLLFHCLTQFRLSGIKFRLY